MQAFNLFNSIMLGGVGYSNSLPLVLAQTYAAASTLCATARCLSKQWPS